MTAAYRSCGLDLKVSLPRVVNSLAAPLHNLVMLSPSQSIRTLISLASKCRAVITWLNREAAKHGWGLGLGLWILASWLCSWVGVQGVSFLPGRVLGGWKDWACMKYSLSIPTLHKWPLLWEWMRPLCKRSWVSHTLCRQLCHCWHHIQWEWKVSYFHSILLMCLAELISTNWMGWPGKVREQRGSGPPVWVWLKRKWTEPCCIIPLCV